MMFKRLVIATCYLVTHHPLKSKKSQIQACIWNEGKSHENFGLIFQPIEGGEVFTIPPNTQSFVCIPIRCYHLHVLRLLVHPPAHAESPPTAFVSLWQTWLVFVVMELVILPKVFLDDTQTISGGSDAVFHRQGRFPKEEGSRHNTPAHLGFTQSACSVGF